MSKASIFITPTPEVDLSIFAGTNIKRLSDDVAGVIKSLNTPPAGLFLGIQDADEQFGRLLEPGGITICAARPSVGKTLFATQVAEYHAARGLNVLIWSLEMSRKQLLLRLISKHSGVSVKKMKNQEVQGDEWASITTAAESVTKSTKTLLVNDISSIQINQIVAESKMIHQRLLNETGKGLELIVVDYIQLIDGAESGNETRQLEIASVSSGLRCLAKDLNLPILALAQLNRDLEKRADKRPNIGDLRESGQIEQDASIITFLYREMIYCEDCKRPGTTCTKNHEHDAELLVAKNRDGETGGVQLYFDGARQLFGSLSHDDKKHAAKLAEQEAARLAKEEAKKKSRVAAGKDKSPKNPYKPHAPKEDALMRGALLNHLMGGK